MTGTATPPVHRQASALAIQGRVLLAIMLRETTTRFGRTRFGYAWALVEPIAHVATLLTIFTLLRRAAPIGNDLSLFFTTGIVPWLMFVNITSRTMKAVDANGALLSYPQVLPIDIMVGRALLESGTLIAVFAILLIGLGALGSATVPGDFLDLAGALACVTVFATGLGLLNGVVVSLLPSYEKLYSAVTRPLYFVSGIFFTADAIPSPLREWMVLNPVLHMIEWTRSGYFQHYDGTHLDRGYAVAIAAVLLFLGLAAERVARDRLRRA
jgi:capsular polysaccharide transport system permease protein